MSALKTKQTVTIKPYSKKELAVLYDVSVYIITVWLKEIASELGTVLGRRYNINQVELIFVRLGIPGQEIIL
jgi:hypothetical protein